MSDHRANTGGLDRDRDQATRRAPGFYWYLDTNARKRTWELVRISKIGAIKVLGVDSAEDGDFSGYAYGFFVPLEAPGIYSRDDIVRTMKQGFARHGAGMTDPPREHEPGALDYLVSRFTGRPKISEVEAELRLTIFLEFGDLILRRLGISVMPAAVTHEQALH